MGLFDNVADTGAAAANVAGATAPAPDVPGVPRIRVTPGPKSTGGLFDDVPFADRFAGEGMAIPQNAPALTAGLRMAADKKIASDDPGGEAKTFIEQFANTAMLNIPRNIDAYSKSRDSGRPFAEEYEKLKDADEAGSRLNRKSSIAGTAAGIGAGMVALPGIGGGATMTARAGRAALTGAGYGGIAEAFDSKDPIHTAIAMGLGFALGGVAAPVAEKIIGLVSGLVRSGRTTQTFLNPDGTLTKEAAEAAQAAGIDPSTFGAVLHRKFAETFAQKGATPASAREAAAGEFNIPLSKGQSTADLDAIRFENMAGRGAYGKPAQDVANEFQTRQTGAMRDAGTDLGEGLAGNRVIVQTPHTAGSTINAEVGANASQARGIVSAADDAATREAAAARGMVDDSGRTIDDIVSGGRPPLSRPQDAGEVVGEAVRTRAAGDRRNFQNLYTDAFSREGQFHAGAFEGVGTRVQGHLTGGNSPVIIDDVTTPVASRAIRDLDGISGLRIQNRADPSGQPNPQDIVAIDLRGVDQARKRLVAFYQAARSTNNAADVRATQRIIDGFDNEVERSISNGLFSGDEGALTALREARAAYSAYQRTFRPQGSGDDVGGAMRRIIERNATPEEIANMLYGSSRTGSTGLSVRLAHRLEETLGRDSEAWGAVRQAAWMRVSQPRNQAGDVDPAKAATNILDFVNGTGQSLANRLFTREELGAMRNHAVGVRELDAAIANNPATRQAEAARTGYQQIFGGDDIGGGQAQAFRRIVSGDATPEETASTVFNAISGNPGNATRVIGAIERITGRDSDSMAAVRQGVWQRLTQNAEGKDQPGAQKIAQNLAEFLNGKGRSVAERLYNPEELGLMRRYANAVKLTVVPPNARTNSDTAPALLAAVNKYSGAVSSILGAGIDGGLTGGLAGYAVNSLLKKGVSAAKEGRAATKASDAFSGAPVAPTAPPRVAPYVGVGAGEAAGQAF